MAACDFSIPFTGDPQMIFNKAKSAVQGQGGTFNGDTSSGDFSVSFFGNSVAGSYTITGQNLNVIITSKPFFVPCNTIESFLRKQIE
jgi:hypothetical protein